MALFVAGVRGAESASGIRPTEARQPPRALYPLVVVAAATGASLPLIGMSWRGMGDSSRLG